MRTQKAHRPEIDPLTPTHDDRKYSFLFGSAPFGGIVTYVQNLKDAIETHNDLETSWLFMEHNPKELISHIPPFSLNWTLKGGLVMRSRIRALENNGKRFDAAFFNHIIPASFLREFGKRVPIVISIDTTPKLLDRYGEWYNTSVGMKASPIEALKHNHVRRLYHRASCLLPWSSWVEDSLITDYGVEKSKIKVVPPGINLKKWIGRPESRGDREGDDKTVRVLFVGGEFNRKGGDLLLKISQLKDFSGCEFHFATKSFSGPRAENVFVHDDLQANSSELIDLYLKADIFALPTRADVSSVAALEAMAMSLPVVITDVGGTSEIVHDDETGFVVPANDEDSFIDRLLRLVKNTELRKQLGQNGRKVVEQNHDLERTADLIVELMKTLSNAGVQKKK